MKDLVFEPTSQKVEAGASHSDSHPSNGSVALDLKQLAALRDDLAACFDIPEAERIISAAQELRPQSSGAESAALFAEMEAEWAHCRLAMAALEQEHIEECREHCDSVLREKPHHALFLGLRVKANAAAKAAEYSHQMAAIARIRSLLDCGPLEEAQNASKAALARFPDSPELCELDLDIREKAIHLRNLVERGETALDIFDVEGAGQCFLRACEQLPFDLSLRGYIISVLHEFAAKAVAKNWQSAQAALQLAQHVQPGTQIPEAITAAIELEKLNPPKQPESVPAVPAELEILEADNALPRPDSEEAVPPPNRETGFIELNGDTNSPPSARSLKAMGLALAAAGALFIAYRIAQPALSPPKRVLEISGIAAGTLTIRSNVAGVHMLINNRPFDMPAGSFSTTIKLPPDVYAIRAAHLGYEAAGPIAAPVKDGAASEIEVDLKPQRASLEIRQAVPGMRISIDGRALGTVAQDGTLRSPVEPGQHTLQLTQNGFQPKTIHVQFGPGEAVDITGAQVTLDSTDARTLPRETAKANVSDLLGTLPPTLRIAVPSLVTQMPPPANLDLRPSEAAAPPGLSTALNIPPPRPALPAQEPARAKANHAEANKADTAAVLAVIQRFASAWSARDLKALTAIESDLDKRALKAQLAPVKVLAMKISPVMPPQIDGEQATVVCRRQADETFSDGSARQNPPALVTYVLAKRDGVWRIEHAQ